MEVVHERCAGLDVHQHSVAGCIRVADGGQIQQEVVPYKELTGSYFDSRNRTKLAKRLIRRRSHLGLQVEVRTAV